MRIRLRIYDAASMQQTSAGNYDAGDCPDLQNDPSKWPYCETKDVYVNEYIHMYCTYTYMYTCIYIYIYLVTHFFV